MRLITALPVLALLLAPPAGAAQTGYPFERYLNIRAATGGGISPDGSRVAFLTNITGNNQVWMVEAGGGWPEQITFFTDRVQWVSWSPAGDRLLLGKDAGGNERTQLWLATPDGRVVEPLTASPKVIHRFGDWSRDGRRIAYSSNERNEAFFDVYVMDLATRRSERVLTHDGDNAARLFGPDDRSLLLERTNASFDSDLYLLDLSTRDLKHLTPHEGTAIYRSAAWPPGDIIYVATDEGRELIGVAAIDIRSPRVTFVEEPRHDVEGVEFSRDGRRMAVRINEGGFTRISLREGGVRGRELTAPAVPKGVTGGIDFSADGRLMTLRVSGSSEPGDIWLHDVGKGSTTRLTRSSLAGIPRESFVEPELVAYRSFDGREIPALLYTPGGAATPAPAIVMVHGGPEGQHRPGFSPINQFFLSRGYTILAPNIRGSTGYGRTFHRLDNGRKREDAINDVAQAAGYLKSAGKVDPARIAVMGGSYGGYMTLAALTFHPDLWAAGVDIVGISNFKSFLKNTGVWRARHRMSEYGDPVADSEFLDKVSPLNHAEKIRAPLIVIQGANDPRVPKSEADQIVANLRSRGRPVEYLVFDDEGHGVARLPNRIKAYTAIADFLDKHLAAPSGSAGSIP